MIHAFERRRIDSDCIDGLVVSELILFQEESNMQFDGYRVIRRRDVSKSYTTDGNSYVEKLMRKEKLWKNPPKWIRKLPLDDWRTFLTALIGKPVIIENERKEDFYIGPIIACEDHSVLNHYFDACGEWLDIERVQYRGITSVQFGDRYSTIYARHLPPRPA